MCAQLRTAGIAVPVAATPTGRWWFPVAPGGTLPAALADRGDVVLYTDGAAVLAPPSETPDGWVHWRVAPALSGYRPSPFGPIVAAVVAAVEEYEGDRLPVAAASRLWGRERARLALAARGSSGPRRGPPGRTTWCGARGGTSPSPRGRTHLLGRGRSSEDTGPGQSHPLRGCGHYGVVTPPAPAPPVRTPSPPALGPRPRRVAVEVGLGVGGPADKARDLRRMKMLATGLLLGATVVFLLARWGEAAGAPGWLGYVRATAEAAMVGALADWFAVTALFRRPMGLPIPHTAIIPRKKDQIGDSLGDFVGENFLAEDVVRDKLGRIEVARRVGEWIGQVPNADRVTAELATAAKGVVTVLRDEDVQEVIDQVLVRKLLEQPAGPPLGAVLEGILNDGAHHRLVDLVCDKAYDWVTANHSTVLRIVEQRAPTWSPRFVDGIIADRVFLEVQTFAWAVKTDPEHPLRKAIDTFLVEFAGDLQRDDDTIERVERIKYQVVEHPEVQRFIGQAWSTVKKLVLDAAEDPSSALRLRVRDGLLALGARLSADTELRAKIDGWLVEGGGLRGAPLPPRDHHADHGHGLPLGRRRDFAQGGAAGGARPAVHPDQRHGRGGVGGAGDLHGVAAGVRRLTNR